MRWNKNSGENDFAQTLGFKAFVNSDNKPDCWSSFDAQNQLQHLKNNY